MVFFLLENRMCSCGILLESLMCSYKRIMSSSGKIMFSYYIQASWKICVLKIFLKSSSVSVSCITYENFLYFFFARNFIVNLEIMVHRRHRKVWLFFSSLFRLNLYGLRRRVFSKIMAFLCKTFTNDVVWTLLRRHYNVLMSFLPSRHMTLERRCMDVVTTVSYTHLTLPTICSV